MSEGAAMRGQTIWVLAKGYAPDEGGMQTYARGVAEAYARAGASVTVFTQTSAGPRQVRIDDVALVDVGAGSGFAVFVRLLARMRAALRDGASPVLVHGTTWRTSVLPMLLGLPYLTTFHGREFMYGGALPLAVMRQVARRAVRIVAVSHYSAGRLQERLGAGHALPLVAWNGTTQCAAAPGERSTRPEPAAPLLLSLCRLEPRKNIAACLHACARLARDGYRFRYVVAGRGPELAALRTLAHALGLDSCTKIVGFVPDEQATALYRRADIFLHPQIAVDSGRDFEGFGIAIADAMAAGAVPIVGTDGGAKELVEEGVSGLAIDGRSPEALRAAIAFLLDSPADRTRMAGNAIARARQHFTWDRHVQRLMDGLPAREGTTPR